MASETVEGLVVQKHVSNLNKINTLVVSETCSFLPSFWRYQDWESFWHDHKPSSDATRGDNLNKINVR